MNKIREEFTVINFQIPLDLAEKLEPLAKKEDRSKSSLLRRLIKDAWERNEATIPELIAKKPLSKEEKR